MEVVSVVLLEPALREVYDLETEHGTFCTSRGIVLKNTDSVFCALDVPAEPGDPGYMRAVFSAAAKAAAAFNATLPPPLALEFDKAMMPFVLVGKKRYAHVPYERPDAPGDVEVKGLSMVRRDTCAFSRSALRGALRALLTRSVGEAVDEASRSVQALLAGAVERRALEFGADRRLLLAGGEPDYAAYYERLRRPMAELFAPFGAAERAEEAFAETRKQIARRAAAAGFLRSFAS
jgi:DNA polymerase elongation subunit (family B)